MPFGCYTGCHATCSSPSLHSGSSCVLNLTSFIHFSFVPHFVALSFQSGSGHPLPMLLCSPAGHRLRYGALLAQTHAYASMPHKAPSLCAHHGLSAILLCAPVGGTRRDAYFRTSLQRPLRLAVVPPKAG